MNRIAQLRKEKDWSQQELADMLEVHQTAVSQWENERTTPNFEALMELCGLFDVRPEYLMGNSNERGHFNPTEEEMDGLGEDAAEAATLRALDSNLRRYYAPPVLEHRGRPHRSSKLVWPTAPSSYHIHGGIFNA